MFDGKSTDFGTAMTARPERRRWTTPRVILSEMVLQNVGAPVNPGVAPLDVKGGSTNSGDGS